MTDMTTVLIRRDRNRAYKGFLCMGHAGYAKCGRPDILCAAVSALTIGAINSLEQLAGERVLVSEDAKTGFLKCDFPCGLQEKSTFLLDSMVFSLENLSREYGERYLQVKYEEV